MSKELVKPGTSALGAILGTGTIGFEERPDFIPEGDKSGTEGITQDDIRLPRLGIAQGLSPQLTPGDSQFIDGLRMFEMFNDTTKDVYGNGPLYFIIVRRDVKCIEFRPRSEGGGIVDMNVPRNDKRVTDWRDAQEPGGKRLPPPATLFNEYIAMLIKADGELEPIVISIKNTNKYNRRAATDLNGYIKMYASQGKKSVPLYGVIYSIKSKFEKNDNGTFGVPVFTAEGFIPKTQPEMFEKVKAYAESLADKEVTIQREPGDDDFDFEAEVVKK